MRREKKSCVSGKKKKNDRRNGVLAVVFVDHLRHIIIAGGPAGQQWPDKQGRDSARSPGEQLGELKTFRASDFSSRD